MRILLPCCAFLEYYYPLINGDWADKETADKKTISGSALLVFCISSAFLLLGKFTLIMKTDQWRNDRVEALNKLHVYWHTLFVNAFTVLPAVCSSGQF